MSRFLLINRLIRRTDCLLDLTDCLKLRFDESARNLSTTTAPKVSQEVLSEDCSSSGGRNNWNEEGKRHHDKHHKSRSYSNWRLGLSSALAASAIIPFNMNTPHDGGLTPPHVIEDLRNAVLEGDERKVRMLIKKCNPNDLSARHQYGWQMLHVAAVNGYAEICEILLKNGAKVNDIDHYSLPRQMAQTLNIDPLVIALTRDTEFNPDLSRADFYGCTALHYAALSNSHETVEVLKRYGANPSIKNRLGFKPSNLASPTIARVLTQYEDEYERRERELEEEERRRYPLEKRIKDNLVGQEAAISTVAATIRRKENGWFDEDHPLVFLFLGSSGIGKTELAKQVAKYLHKDNKNAFIRLDMSEYQEQHSVARMIGSPPGYVGHQEGGQLTAALESCKNAVVLFDEVEKAHPKVLTVLLQLFDEGRLTDGKGRTIECKDAIFIMTSNLASEAIAEHAVRLRQEQQSIREVELENRLRFGKPGDEQDGERKSKNSEEDVIQEKITISRKFKDTIVRPVLKAHFQRDEFLGRINEMVYFLPFSDSELRQLVTRELNIWAAKAKKKNNIEMTWDDQVVEVICKGYDIHYGARSIKHEVERRIINQISELHHSVKKAKRVHVSVCKEAGEDLINIKIS